MGRWVLAITFLLISLIVAFGILVATGVIDGPALFWRWGMRIGWLQPHLETYAHGRDAEGWIAQQETELRAKLTEVERREADLQAELGKLEQRAQQLDKRESELAAWEARLQQEQEQRRNVQSLAQIYSGMDAADAARILQALDQDLLLEVLLELDTFQAAEIMALLPTNLAAALSKQMGQASD